MGLAPFLLKSLRFAILAGLVLGLPACATRTETAVNAAAKGGFSPQRLSLPRFDLSVWTRQRPVQGQPLIAYIEGDGLAFLNINTISDDPTPVKPLAMMLAAQDMRPNVVYLARPCQFGRGMKDRNCHPAYWTNARYAEEVVADMNTALDRLHAQHGTKGIHLIGYSGGGAIAALLAARRSDVLSVVSVAGVMDHQVWTRREEISPLQGSLNPVHSADRLAAIPQIHFSGGKDDVVPPYVAQSYVSYFPVGSRPRIVSIPDADHECCWVERWPTYLKMLP